MRLERGSLATSTVSRRSWGPGLHHLIDPRTSMPAMTGVVQATVWASTCADAEIAAKEALLTGRRILDRVPGVLVLSSGEVVTNLGPSLPRTSRGIGHERSTRAGAGAGREERRRMIMWITLRAAGIGAFVMLFLAVSWGIVGTTSLFGKKISKQNAILVHQFMSTVGLVLMATHIILLLVDSFMPFRLRDVLIPMTSSFRPVAITFGVLAMYATAHPAVELLDAEVLLHGLVEEDPPPGRARVRALDGARHLRRHRYPAPVDVGHLRGQRPHRRVPRHGACADLRLPAATSGASRSRTRQGGGRRGAGRGETFAPTCARARGGGGDGRGRGRGRDERGPGRDRAQAIPHSGRRIVRFPGGPISPRPPAGGPRPSPADGGPTPLAEPRAPGGPGVRSGTGGPGRSGPVGRTATGGPELRSQ